MPDEKRREEHSKTGQKGGETRREEKGTTHRGGETQHGGKGGEEHRR